MAESRLFESVSTSVPNAEPYPSDLLHERLLSSFEEVPDGESIDGAIAARKIFARLPENISQHPAALRAASEIAQIPSGSVEDVTKKILPIIQYWIIEQFGTVEAFESMGREIVLLKEGIIPVNDLVNYDVVFGRGDDKMLNLHIHSSVGLFSKSPFVVTALFNGAMRKIARDLMDKPELHDVTRVTGSSPLLMRFYPVMERRGWTIERNEDGTVRVQGNRQKRASMDMDRETFLKHFAA